MLLTNVRFASLTTIACFLASTSLADHRFDDEVYINGPGDGFSDRLCIGDNCIDGEAYPDNTIKLRIKDDDTGLEFQDVNPGNDDWVIETNRGGINNLQIRNATESSIPLVITGGSNSNALAIGATGDIGIGTRLPQADLHILRPLDPKIRFEQSGNGGVPPQEWTILGNEFNFSVFNSTVNSRPLTVRASSGNVGLGVRFPEGKLHTKGDGVQLAYFESGDGGPVQVRFRTDSENRRFLAVNNANEVKTQVIFRDSEILFTGPTDSGANRWLTIGPSGIISRGPTCNPGPCDATFDPEQFEVPPLKERTAYMWEHQHLWAVGPTKPGEPINLTEKTGAMLHELEVAYIYIEQLHDRLEAQDELNAQLLSRLEALEAK